MFVKYPTGVKKNHQKEVYHGNRGMALEDDINTTNEYYLQNNIAVIHKKPTPITIKKTKIPKIVLFILSFPLFFDRKFTY